MSRLSVKLEYDKKVAELVSMVESKAKELQNVTEAKDVAILEVRQLGERKAALGKVLVVLEGKIKEAQEHLDQTVAREGHFVSSVKVELKKEKDSLKEVSETLEKTTERVNEMSPIAKELEQFLEKESTAQAKWLEAEKKLNASVKQYLDMKAQADADREDIAKQNQAQDAYKNYLTDFYGKLATYVRVAKETVEWVDEELEKRGVPVRFDLPPGEIMQIDFNNFNKKPTDT